VTHRNWPHSLKPESYPYLTSKKAFALLAFFGFLDVVLSAFALTFWDAKELNPAANVVWRDFGFFGLLGGKMLLYLLVLVYHDFFPKSGRMVVWLCATIQIVVVTLTLSVHLIV
jgi:hypothetical protein